MKAEYRNSNYFASSYFLQSLRESNNQLSQEKEDLLHQMKQQTEKWEEKKVKTASLFFLCEVKLCFHFHFQFMPFPTA